MADRFDHPALRTRMERVQARHRELREALEDPQVASLPKRLQALGQEEAKLRPVVELYELWVAADSAVQEAEAMRREETLGEMQVYLEEEAREQGRQRDQLAARLQELLVPANRDAERDAVLEVRAGTGGDEAALFAADLLRMYLRYAERRGWTVDVVDQSATEGGGIKEVVAEVRGPGAYERLQFESGVHRVQRVPRTESQGRIHTSAASVVVLPEADDVEVELREEDLKVDVYRSTGPGGQSVNTTDSAVRITHLPSGLVVTCQDEKSQHKNKAKALRVLRARLFERLQAERDAELRVTRQSMVRSGDRSEKVRTYNFPEARLTDHRIDLKLHQLARILEGDLDPVVEPLLAAERARRLGEDHLPSPDRPGDGAA
ncbi:MAG TPA: peptide chain release factor 1 [Verrucomicrobiae bacterium]|nr:peptide chain release factor 1 [Verrucomicrobiae bacterium]